MANRYGFTAAAAKDLRKLADAIEAYNVRADDWFYTHLADELSACSTTAECTQLRSRVVLLCRGTMDVSRDIPERIDARIANKMMEIAIAEGQRSVDGGGQNVDMG